MASVLRYLCLTVLVASTLMAQSAWSPAKFLQPRRLAPFVTSPPSVVDQMLDAAALKPGETLYDLGCGDGRFLIAAVQKYRAKAIGVELSPSLAKSARENLEKSHVQDMATVIQGDLMTVDLSPADVVTIYLTTEFNDELRPNLEKYLRAGSRVVSFEYPIPGWKPQRKETAELYNRKHTIYVYMVSRKK